MLLATGGTLLLAAGWAIGSLRSSQAASAAAAAAAAAAASAYPRTAPTPLRARPGPASPVRSRPGPVIVGVAGASGSGKTSLAEAAAAQLAGAVLAISCDSYYKPLPDGANAAEHNFDDPASLDMDLLADHLAALRRGEDILVPEYDFTTHKRTTRTTRVSPRTTAAIIVDGIFVLAAERVAAQCDITVFCAEDGDVCLARRLRRDVAERGRTPDSVIAQYLKFVKRGYELYVAPTMNRADIIIPRARDNVTAIAMLVRELQYRIDVAARAGVGSAVGVAPSNARLLTFEK